jgi:hypothetical protein
VLFLILIFATFRIVALVTWLALAPVVVIHSVFGSLTGFVFLPLRPRVLLALLMLRHHLLSGIIVFSIIVFLQGVLCIFSPSCTCIYSSLWPSDKYKYYFRFQRNSKAEVYLPKADSCNDKLKVVMEAGPQPKFILHRYLSSQIFYIIYSRAVYTK